MSDVLAVLGRKGSAVLTIAPSASVLEAAQLMNQHKVGAVVVVEQERVRGIFTERDVLRRVVAECADPSDMPVAEAMTSEVVTCRHETPLDQARNLFMQRRIRHLPVLDDEENLVGLISIGDLNAWDLSGQECKIAALEEYLYGVV